MPQAILQPENIFDLKNIVDAQISPDGKKAVYVVSETDLSTNKRRTSLWLLYLDRDTQPIRLTAHDSDASPRWAPDSQRLAFVSSRQDEKAQLYVININGGEAQQIKTEKAPSSTPLWNPDGRSIAFKAMVELKPEEISYPGAPPQPQSTEQEKNEKDAQKQEPVHVVTDINYQADRRGLIYHKFAQLFVVDLEKQECQQLTSGQQRIGDFIWNNSGNSLLYLVDVYHEAKAQHTTAVHQIDIGQQTSSKLLDFDGSLHRLDLAPAGRWLLLTGTDNSYPPGTGATKLWAVDLHSPSLPLQHGDVRCLTQELEASCSQAHWEHNSQSIYFVKRWHGATQFCQLLFDDGTAGQVVQLPLTDLAMISQYDMAHDGSLIFIAHNFTTPPELYRRYKGQTSQLTRLNQEFVDKYELCPAEKFTYKGADDWDIDGWLVRPLNYEEGRRYPTVLNVHGGPTGAYTDGWNFTFQLLAHHGFAVVFTNPRGSTTYGSEFSKACCQDLGGKDYIDIMAGVDQAIEMGVADPNRLGITGWSYGGYMTCWTVTQTDRFKAAIAGACISNWHDLYGCGDTHVYAENLFGGAPWEQEERFLQRSPIRHVRNVQTPVLLLHGEKDIRCPTSQSDQFFTALKRLGKEAVFVRYPGQYHGLGKPNYVVDRWQRTLSWFKYYLMGQGDK